MKETIALIVAREPHLRRWIGPFSFISRNDFASEQVYTPVNISEQCLEQYNIAFTLCTVLDYYCDGQAHERVALYQLSIATKPRLIERLEEKLQRNAHWRCLQDGTVTNRWSGVFNL